MIAYRGLLSHSIIYAFPRGGPHLAVRVWELREGEEMRDVIAYFTEMYGQATLFDGVTMAYLGPERRSQARAA